MHHTVFASGRTACSLRAAVLGLTMLLALLVPSVLATSTLPVVDAALAEQLTNALTTTFEAFDVSGCSAAVLLPDGALWTGTSGISHDDVPVTANMLFALGSVTKNYVVPVILQLVEEEILSLDDVVSDVLLELSLDTDPTLLQLLNARSGLCNVTDRSDLWDAVLADPSYAWTANEVLETYPEDPCFLPDETWHYSNTAYLIAGLMAERALGTGIAQSIRTRFLDPLELHETVFAVAEPFPEDAAVCHGWFDFDHDGTVDDVAPVRTGVYSVLGASGAIFASAPDVARWVDALFRGDVLSAASLDAMLTPYSILPDTGGAGYGLAVQLLGEDAITHSGRSFGYLSLFLHLKSSGVTIVVLINGDDALCLDDVSSALIVVVMNAQASIGAQP